MAASNQSPIPMETFHRTTLPIPDLERQSTSEMRSRHFNIFVDPSKGFPSLAVTKMTWGNTATFRTFEYVYWRLLDFYESKMAFLEHRLCKLDIAEDRKIGGSQRAWVPFDKKSFDDCSLRDNPQYLSEPREANGSTSQDEIYDTRERIFAHLQHYGRLHREILCWIEKSKTFPRVSTRAYDQLFTMAQEVHGLKKEALDHWKEDETVYMSINPVELWISNAHLSTLSLVKKIFQWLPTTDVLTENDGSQYYQSIGADIFKVLRKVLVILFGVSSVLVPGGLLYLGELSKRANIGIVAGFGLLFGCGTFLVEKRIGHVVVIVVGYLAVLATFLSSMP